MKRLMLALLLGTAAFRAEAVDYTDIWFNPAQAGYGYNLVQSDGFLFVTFFIYGPSGAPTWYTGELNWNNVDAFAGDVYLNTGTFFGAPWIPANLVSTKVGTATFRPIAANNYQGTLAYTVTGVGSATHVLQRQTLTAIATAGSYAGTQFGEYSGCATPAGNFAYRDTYDLTVADGAAGSINYHFAYDSGLTCDLAGKYAPHGQYYTVSGATYTCDDGTSATADMVEIKRTALGIEGRYTATGLPDGCAERATFAGPKAP